MFVFLFFFSQIFCKEVIVMLVNLCSLEHSPYTIYFVFRFHVHFFSGCVLLSQFEDYEGFGSVFGPNYQAFFERFFAGYVKISTLSFSRDPRLQIVQSHTAVRFVSLPVRQTEFYSGFS